MMGLFMRSGRSGGNWRCGCSSPELAAGRCRWRLRPCDCRPVYPAATTTRGWIVGRKGGSHLTDLQHPWRRIRAKADLLNERIHDLRHSYATRIRDAGMPLQLIARQFGHKWLRTTEHYYVGIDREIADEVIRKVLSEL